MAGKDYNKEIFTKVRVCGIECGFNDMRIDRGTAPKGKYLYEVAGDDVSGGDPVRVQPGVLVNFFGTLVCDERCLLGMMAAVSNQQFMQEICEVQKYYKDGKGVVEQCCYYDRKYKRQDVTITPPHLVSCFFVYSREEILKLMNHEICCDFTHMIVTDGIDIDSNKIPLCGAI